MSAEITSGWLQGRMIRRARKAGRCAQYRLCKHEIQRGELYAEGELDPYTAGGFALERYCLPCAGEEAQAAARSLETVHQ
ncbi:MAG TPA: hypothetical protein VFL96_14840 [Acidobacteriaceae bacterium]|nr:hypothetical protein [Acidobacteriaceae bacterium]